MDSQILNFCVDLNLFFFSLSFNNFAFLFYILGKFLDIII